jgi:hypothetical protein
MDAGRLEVSDCQFNLSKGLSIEIVQAEELIEEKSSQLSINLVQEFEHRYGGA